MLLLQDWPITLSLRQQEMSLLFLFSLWLWYVFIIIIFCFMLIRCWYIESLGTRIKQAIIMNLCFNLEILLSSLCQTLSNTHHHLTQGRIWTLLYNFIVLIINCCLMLLNINCRLSIKIIWASTCRVNVNDCMLLFLIEADNIWRVVVIHLIWCHWTVSIIKLSVWLSWILTILLKVSFLCFRNCSMLLEHVCIHVVHESLFHYLTTRSFCFLIRSLNLIYDMHG